MNKTFTTLKDNISGDLQDTSVAMKARIGRYINKRYFDILRRINWQNARPDYTKDSASGTQDYTLPVDFGKEIYVLDTTNKLKISRIDLQTWVAKYASNPTGTGTPDFYVILDSPVATQPSAASKLACVSSSASDTSQVLHIRGIADGVEVEEDVTLTGTTSVDSSNSYTRILGISKSAVTAGYVTITSNSGAVTIAVISKETLETRYKIMRLAPIPSTTITYSIPYIIKPLPLVDQYDYPVIDCADIIEIGALADGQRYKKQDAKANNLEILYEKAIIDLIWSEENQFNQIRVMGTSPYSRETTG